MAQFLELLKIILPAILVFVTAWVLFEKYLGNQPKPVQADSKTEKLKILLPLKLKAYERLVIFLERISPTSMVMRLNKAGMSSTELQIEILKAVREEFEHNLSLQIYVSEASWTLIKAAKEEILQMVKQASSKCGHDANSLELSKALFELEAQLQQSLYKTALSNLRKEIHREINSTI